MIEYYTKRAQETEKALSDLKKKLYTTSTLRLCIFLAIAVFCFFLKTVPVGASVGIIAAGVLLFGILIVKHHRLQKQKHYLEASLACDNNEIKALNLDLSPFDGAPEQLSSAHSFSLDLDLFGNNNSLFQLINRSCTDYGRQLLIRIFEEPLNDKKAIEERQEIVKELREKPELLHHFRVSGLIKTGTKTDYEEIKEFARSERFIAKHKLWIGLSYLVPSIWVLAFILAFTIQIPFNWWVWLYVLTFVLSESLAKKINRLQQYIGKKADILNSYTGLIRIIENETFTSEGLKIIQRQFAGKEKASASIRQLAQLISELEQRSNMLAHILLNPLLLWDIRKAIRIEMWKEKAGEDLISWMQGIGEFDAYTSLGLFSFNHPDYTFPNFTETYFQVNGKGLRHPLLNREACVENDVSIDNAPYFLIITGANMAGKSTYLRTVGVNFVLACMGTCVCAKEFSLFPAKLVTSLRTSDSLNDNESYFFAELKRLKMIINRLEDGEQLFIILDEILKGTNSLDKQRGSLALVRQFVRLQSCGIIATHDLLLGELEKDFPDHIKNYRFEADIENDRLQFSYRLQTGIAQNMNASFLMKKMGITL